MVVSANVLGENGRLLVGLWGGKTAVLPTVHNVFPEDEARNGRSRFPIHCQLLIGARRPQQTAFSRAVSPNRTQTEAKQAEEKVQSCVVVNQQ